VTGWSGVLTDLNKQEVLAALGRHGCGGGGGVGWGVGVGGLGGPERDARQPREHLGTVARVHHAAKGGQVTSRQPRVHAKPAPTDLVRTTMGRVAWRSSCVCQAKPSHPPHGSVSQSASLLA
jgi:hypothetical protein